MAKGRSEETTIQINLPAEAIEELRETVKYYSMTPEEALRLAAVQILESKAGRRQDIMVGLSQYQSTTEVDASVFSTVPGESRPRLIRRRIKVV